jgi:DNA-binding transcriptional LysR family regulator
MSDFNHKVIQKLLDDNNLLFKPLFVAEPHVFLSTSHPLADKEVINPQDLDDYPFLTFEQGTYNSFYFSEEMFIKESHKKIINVSDRATLFNLLIGLNGYTICSGVLNSNLNGNNISAVRLNTNERMTVGFIQSKKINLSNIALEYMNKLKQLIRADGFDIIE